MSVVLEYERPQGLAEYQLALMDHPARFVVVEAATKTGKTTSCLIWLIERALAGREGQNYWWVAPVHTQAKMALDRTSHFLRQYDRQCQRAGLAFAYEVNRSAKTITLPNGAVLSFRSAKEPDNLYGDDVYAAVIDEATRCSETTWVAIRSTLTATGGPCKIIGNVKGARNWVHLKKQLATDDPENWAYFRITAWDAVYAGVLSRAEVEAAQKDLSEEEFKELYLAEPTEDGANPFGLKHIESCITPEHVEGRPRFFGVDIAVSNDWTVICGLDGKGRLVHFDRFRLGNYAQTLQRIRAATSAGYPWIDATGIGAALAEQLTQHNRNAYAFTFTAKSKETLVWDLAEAIQNQRIRISDRNTTLLDELRQYERTFDHQKHKSYFSAPPGYHDDCVMALALAVRSMSENAAKASPSSQWL